jgi:hypothetical protein
VIFGATRRGPVIDSGRFIGTEVPVRDIAGNFSATNRLITSMAQGCDLAKRLGSNNIALMRAVAFAAVGPSLIEVVRMSIYLFATPAS